MCLSIAIQRPKDVLGQGKHAGHEWMIVHNWMGYRCGYVRVDKGHAWFGKDYDDVPAEIHGGLTFAEPDQPCGKGGADDGWWVGFDCAHGGDNPDPVHMKTCDQIRDTAHRHGIKACMHCASAAFAAGAIKRGFDLIMLTSDVACLTAGARRQLDDLKTALA